MEIESGNFFPGEGTDVVVTMAKPPDRSARGGGRRNNAKGDQTTLTVSLDAAELVNKAAGVKGLTIRQLFDDKQVRSFFRHLMLAEVQEELKKEGEPPAGPPAR